MSYDIYISGGEQCKHCGHIPPGADINFSYNAGKYFYHNMDTELGVRWLYGKTGQETIPVLERIVKEAPTPEWPHGIAKDLLEMAQHNLNGIWGGD